MFRRRLSKIRKGGRFKPFRDQARVGGGGCDGWVIVVRTAAAEKTKILEYMLVSWNVVFINLDAWMNGKSGHLLQLRRNSRGLLPHRSCAGLRGNPHLRPDVQQSLLLRVHPHGLRVLKAGHKGVHDLRLGPHLKTHTRRHAACTRVHGGLYARPVVQLNTRFEYIIPPHSVSMNL